MESTGALARGPSDPLIAGLNVEGAARKEEDRDGLIVDDGDVVVGGACNTGLMEVLGPP